MFVWKYLDDGHTQLTYRLRGQIEDEVGRQSFKNNRSATPYSTSATTIQDRQYLN